MSAIYLIISLFLVTLLCSCSTPGLRMLDERAEYEKVNEIKLHSTEASLKGSKAMVTDVFVHPHEMPSGDYFLGGWIRTVIKSPRWNKTKAIKKAGK